MWIVPHRRTLEFYGVCASTQSIPDSYASAPQHFGSPHVIHSQVFRMLPARGRKDVIIYKCLFLLTENGLVICANKSQFNRLLIKCDPNQEREKQIYCHTSKSIISRGCGASGLSSEFAIGMPSFLISFSKYRNFLSISSQRRTSLTNLRWNAFTSGLS